MGRQKSGRPNKKISAPGELKMGFATWVLKTRMFADIASIKRYSLTGGYHVSWTSIHEGLLRVIVNPRKDYLVGLQDALQDVETGQRNRVHHRW